MLKRERQIEQAFKCQREYFEMMRAWHEKHNGLAIEPKMQELIEANLTGKVIDAGCGEGSVLLWFARRRNPNTKFYGVDISPIGIEMASKAKDVENAFFIVANLKKLPFPDVTFDFIYSQSVIEHIVDYQKALVEFKRILKPSGRLLMRFSNGGREDKGIIEAFFNYLLRRNKVVKLNPTLSIGTDKSKDHKHNYDANRITSDIFLKQLKVLGFQIKLFSTNRESALSNQGYNHYSFWQKFLRKCYATIPIWPFTHLGNTIIVLVEK